MQQKRSFWKRLTGKGYYIALAVCAAAVAVSGVLFVHSLREELPDPALARSGAEDILPTPPADWDAIQPTEEGGAPVAALDPTEGSKPDAAAPTESEPDGPAPSEPAGETKKSVITAPVDGAVRAGYSMEKLIYNQTTKDWRAHVGLDYDAPIGTPVRAAADGKVVAVYEDDLLGWTVKLEHEGGWVTRYSNLAQETAVSVGDPVTSGQKLGAVGKSALLELADPPHLHFAVFRNNVPQDPETFLGQ